MKTTIETYPRNYLHLIYKAGRNCYGTADKAKSASPQEKQRFAKMLIRRGHESVLEHICVSVYSWDVSRSFLAQLTRHRLVSYSVKSQHYVKHNDFRYKELEDWGKEKQMQTKLIYRGLMEHINGIYKQMIKLGVPHYIAREVLPNACLTDMFITTNVREWRYIIGLRITEGNTPEIQRWAKDILVLFYEKMPELFEDLIEKHLPVVKYLDKIIENHAKKEGT